jgi:hypothetical protein
MFLFNKNNSYKSKSITLYKSGFFDEDAKVKYSKFIRFKNNTLDQKHEQYNHLRYNQYARIFFKCKVNEKLDFMKKSFFFQIYMNLL